MQTSDHENELDAHHAEEPLSVLPGGNGSLGTSPLLFEVSWEVCAQSGGIYTVLRSKAPEEAARWGDDYWLIGPYRHNSAVIEFEAEAPTGVVADVIQQLADRGIRVHCGRWLVTGRPHVLLVDVDSALGGIADMKYYLWKDIGIGTPAGDWELDRIIAFGHVVSEFLGRVCEKIGARPMLGHFHEWQGAVALPLLKKRGVRFPTIFTTHATQVGRSLCAANDNLYDHIGEIDAGAVAWEHGFAHKFQLEQVAAQWSEVFTTVSGITALEAQQFLGRQADVLLPNGLNIDRFAAPYEFQNLHRNNKQLISEFVMGHFFSSYTFDLDRTLYIFTAGRYEYRNKGFDVFIEALHQLNQKLRHNPNGVTVVAFIIAPGRYRGLNVETLNRQAMFHELREACMSFAEDMGDRLFYSVADGRMPSLEELLDESSRVRIKRMSHAWRQRPQPTIVTHDLVDDGNDPVLCHLRARGLFNSKEDSVKVVFHPEFITSTSPILGLEYDQFVRGCNLGVFPSYYEPWGYTPMECVVRGIPAITSDLSGFGAYVMSHFPDHDENGIFVARRRKTGFDRTVNQVADWLYHIATMARRDRIQLRNRVESHADHFGWNNMTRYYRTARQWAFQKFYPGREVLPAEPDPNAPRPRPSRRSKGRKGRKAVVPQKDEH